MTFGENVTLDTECDVIIFKYTREEAGMAFDVTATFRILSDPPGEVL